MEVMLFLFALFVMFACAWFAWAASRHAADAEHSSSEVKNTRGRLIALEGALESLQAQHQKLSGRFYALKQELDVDGANDENELDGIPHAANPRGLPQLALDSMIVCEQWAIAQRDGPSSPAARCECGYCTQRRAHRERQRNALVPKTVQGQAEMAKLNAGKP